jgi:hypothetical protein
VPRGRLHLSTTAGDAVDLDPKRDEPTWVLNVGHAHCYELRSYSYSAPGAHSSMYFGGVSEPHRDLLFAVEADWFFEAPPSSILVDKPPSGPPSSSTLRHALEIVRCPGAPLPPRP